MCLRSFSVIFIMLVVAALLSAERPTKFKQHDAIVLLYESTSGTPQLVSTGLIVATDSKHKYLVAARHTFHNDRTEVWRTELQLRHASNKNPYDAKEAVAVKLLSDRASDPEPVLWREYDGISDIAVLQLSLEQSARLPAAIPLSDLDAMEQTTQGEEILVLGASSGIPMADLNEPLLIPGLIASAAQPSLGGQLIISAPISPGNSGSTVFTKALKRKNGSGRIIGIVSQAGFYGNIPSGLAYVEPIFKVRSLIQHVANVPTCCVPVRKAVVHP